MIAALVFIFGLIIGSFLNAVIYRLAHQKSPLRGRSLCPHCKHTLSFFDLVPVVSFIALRGRCRYCNRPISWQYPLVELVTALSFTGVYLRLSSQSNTFSETILQTILFASYSAFLIVIFAYDLKHYLILDAVIVPAVVVSLLGNLYLGEPVLKMLGAALLASGFFAIQFILSKGRWIGGGDIRLGFLMGIMVSWPNILVALLIAYMVGSAVGLTLIALGRMKLDSKVPFGTFLTVASYLTLLYGSEVLLWYRRLASL